MKGSNKDAGTHGKERNEGDERKANGLCCFLKGFDTSFPHHLCPTAMFDLSIITANL